jgi:energy-coupling factor transporter ATP-binding protein EcfA2
MLGVLVLSAQRLLPLMQQIYAGWTSIRGMADTLHIVRQWLQLEVPKQVPPQASPQPLPMSITHLLKPVKPGVSKAFIELNDVSFAYQPSMPRVLNHINLTIYQGQRIGLFGTTGGGKSTLLDILMGLLEPTTGQLLVDGNVQYSANSNPDAGAWRRHMRMYRSIFFWRMHLSPETLLLDCHSKQSIMTEYSGRLCKRISLNSAILCPKGLIPKSVSVAYGFQAVNASVLVLHVLYIKGRAYSYLMRRPVRWTQKRKKRSRSHWLDLTQILRL